MDTHPAHDGRDTGRLDGDAFLTVAEVAAMTRVSKMTIYRLVHSGGLAAVRLGRSYRIRGSVARAMLERASVTRPDDGDPGRWQA